MAYYDYQCRDCRKKFTVQQSFSEHDDERTPKCPKCGSKSVDRQIAEVHVKTSRKS